LPSFLQALGRRCATPMPASQAADQAGAESNPTIALTGATGFVGGAVARQLVSCGWRVRALCRPGSRARAELPGDIDWLPGRLEDRASLRRLVHGCQAVVHCAGAVRGADWEGFQQVNVEGTQRLLEAAREGAQPPRLLLISSLAAREPQLSPYAASKRQAELLLEHQGGDMAWTILRPPAVYGPGDQELRPLFQWLARGVAVVPGSGQGRVSLIYVEDLGRAVASVIGCEDVHGRTFGLHDGRAGGYSWEDVIEALSPLRSGRGVWRLRIPEAALRPLAAANVWAARLGGPAPMLTPGKLRELTHPDWVCDNAELAGVTGWQPQVSLLDGVRACLGRAQG